MVEAKNHFFINKLSCSKKGHENRFESQNIFFTDIHTYK